MAEVTLKSSQPSALPDQPLCGWCAERRGVGYSWLCALPSLVQRPTRCFAHLEVGLVGLVGEAHVERQEHHDVGGDSQAVLVVGPVPDLQDSRVTGTFRFTLNFNITNGPPQTRARLYSFSLSEQPTDVRHEMQLQPSGPEHREEPH